MVSGPQWMLSKIFVEGMVSLKKKVSFRYVWWEDLEPRKSRQVMIEYPEKYIC